MDEFGMNGARYQFPDVFDSPCGSPGTVLDQNEPSGYMSTDKLRSCSTFNAGIAMVDDQFKGLNMAEIEQRIQVPRMQSEQ